MSKLQMLMREWARRIDPSTNNIRDFVKDAELVAWEMRNLADLDVEVFNEVVSDEVPAQV